MPISFHIPQYEIRFEFSRSGGKGGQNVNKVETRVQVFWNIRDSRVLNYEQKVLIEKKLTSHMNWRGEVVVEASSERSQMQNREVAVSRLQALVQKALHVPKKRRATRPTRASVLKRLQGKSLHSHKKGERAKIFLE